jgi:hypothetical protein
LLALRELDKIDSIESKIKYCHHTIDIWKLAIIKIFNDQDKSTTQSKSSKNNSLSKGSRNEESKPNSANEATKNDVNKEIIENLHREISSKLLDENI